MRKTLLIILMFIVTSSLMARKRTAAELINTGNASQDSILLALNKQITQTYEAGIGKMALNVYVKGISTSLHTNKVSKYFRNLIPFETSADQQTAIEALCKVSYQSPCDMLISPVALRSNSRKGRKVLQESYKILLPTFSLKQMRSKGYEHPYILPFSDDGLLQYTYQFIDTTYTPDHGKIICIAFSPRKDNHSLITGNAKIRMSDLSIVSIDFSGLVDFGKLDYSINLQNYGETLVPTSSNARISYSWGGAKGMNEYECVYDIDELTTLHDFDQRHASLDLTDIYEHEPIQTADFDTIRLIPLSAHEDSVLVSIRQSVSSRRSRSLFETIPERLVGSSDINAFGTDLRIYGPLYPASVGYDKFNGITLRERIRWAHDFNNEQSIVIKPEIGYSFRLKEFRYRFDTEWIYGPRRRAGVKLTLRNGSSGFSSKFKDAVDNKIENLYDKTKNEKDENRPWKKVWLQNLKDMDFSDLGLEYYNRYIFNLEQSFEIATGLMCYLGAEYNYRKPVHHGSRALDKVQLSNLVNDYYSDMNPYLRLTWTPRQYYHFRGRQKLYLSSNYPTFSAEFAQGVYGFCGSTSNYSRAELDVQHNIRLDDVRSLSYHIGTGAFFRQNGEYFINYKYFSRSQYPSTWDNRIGGIFSLLNDYWYSSSPAYLQSHIMFESPFLLLHNIKPVAKYVIKERIYHSLLLANGKSLYNEIGYGMGNNYFDVGVFCGFVGLSPMDAGLKFTINIDQHL
ncbi:MAG: hypothetical protein KBT20_09430 [Bacteroidales bacterium]|nr:hypothetical protein [Candidatus Liminaster caballi]